MTYGRYDSVWQSLWMAPLLLWIVEVIEIRYNWSYHNAEKSSTIGTGSSFTAVAIIYLSAIQMISQLMYMSRHSISTPGPDPQRNSRSMFQSHSTLCYYLHMCLLQNLNLGGISEAFDWSVTGRFLTLFEVEQRLYHRWVFADVKAQHVLIIYKIGRICRQGDTGQDVFRCFHGWDRGLIASLYIRLMGASREWY